MLSSNTFLQKTSENSNILEKGHFKEGTSPNLINQFVGDIRIATSSWLENTYPLHISQDTKLFLPAEFTQINFAT